MMGMKKIKNNSIPFILTDIPYDAVNRSSNGLRNLDKKHADVITFDLNEFLEDIYRIASNSIVIFCGKEQFSTIYGHFASKKGTVRPIVWEKSNPSPMNGQHIYLSGVELAVWFKKVVLKLLMHTAKIQYSNIQMEEVSCILQKKTINFLKN